MWALLEAYPYNQESQYINGCITFVMCNNMVCGSWRGESVGLHCPPAVRHSLGCQVRLYCNLLCLAFSVKLDNIMIVICRYIILCIAIGLSLAMYPVDQKNDF